jgi:ubiquitin carboxyl-terminal hydrolase MINDY-1/2
VLLFSFCLSSCCALCCTLASRCRSIESNTSVSSSCLARGAPSEALNTTEHYRTEPNRTDTTRLRRRSFLFPPFINPTTPPPQGTERRILLQNENGPCPLLAACNALLLRGDVEFPPSCVRNSVASLDDVTNMLANQALRHLQATATATAAPSPSQQQQQLLVPPEQQQEQHDYFLHELLTHIPTFQYGMDVNPSLTCGIDGYEWTAQLSAFDMLRVKLVHGWLVDPSSQSEIYRAVGSECYNSLVERIIESREAAAELEAVQIRLAAAFTTAGSSGGANPTRVAEMQRRAKELAHQVTRGTLIDAFLNSAAHQLTDYGLGVLHEQIKEGEMVAFFRNNHFGTLTKHKGTAVFLSAGICCSLACVS